jgi:hypothetical protein
MHMKEKAGESIINLSRIYSLAVAALMAMLSPTLLSCATGPSNAAHANRPPLMFLNQAWSIVDDLSRGPVLMLEYRPSDSTTGDWVQTLTVVRVPEVVPHQELVDRLRSKFQADGCPASDFRLESSLQESIVVQNFSRCATPRAEMRFLRHTRKDGELWSLLYATRKNLSAAESRRIVAALRNLPLQIQ